MKYKFDQFESEIEDPTIEIDTRTIHLNAIDMKMSVDVALIVDQARMVVKITEIPFVFPFDLSSLDSAVNTRLQDYEQTI